MEYFFFGMVPKVQRNNTDGSGDCIATSNADREIYLRNSPVLPLVPHPNLSKVALVLN
jgi:hypothetical protein